MIQLNHSYSVLFVVTSAGVGTAADATPTAVLYRNGSASGVAVTVSTTAQTGLYKATFTTDSGWSSADHLELYATATIGGTSGYLAMVWSSTEYASTFAAGDDVNVASIDTDAIDADSIAAAAVTKIQNGLATSSALATVAANVTTLLSRVTATVATLWANLTAMISGSSGTAAFTETALANAPAGGSGGLDAAGVRAAVGLTSANLDTQLSGISAKTTLITGTGVSVVSSVTQTGDITVYIGDDDVGAFAIPLPVSDVDESLYDYLQTCDSIVFGAGLRNQADQITGTVDKTAISHANGITTVPVEIPSANKPAVAANYVYHVKAVDSDGRHVKLEGTLHLKAKRVT